MTDLNRADLHLVSHTTSDGVTTRELVLGDVTAALRAPEHAAPGTPLVLLGHGGGRQHRHHPAVSGRARLLTDVRFRAVALDVDGHGPRPRTADDEEEVAVLDAARRAGEPIGPIVERYNADLARRTVPEWRALLAGLLAVPEIGHAPVGYWGITLGTAIGVPLVPEEPLIQAAVLGLFWPSTLVEACAANHRSNRVRPAVARRAHPARGRPRPVRRVRVDGEVAARQRREAHGAAVLRGDVSGPVLRAAPAGLASGEAAAALPPTRYVRGAAESRRRTRREDLNARTGRGAGNAGSFDNK